MSQCKNQSWATVHFQLPPCGMVMMDKLSLIVSVSFIKSMIKSLVSKAKGMRASSVMMLLSWVWYSSYTHLSNLHQKCKILALRVSNNKLIKWSNAMRKSKWGSHHMVHEEISMSHVSIMIFASDEENFYEYEVLFMTWQNTRFRSHAIWFYDDRCSMTTSAW